MRRIWQCAAVFALSLVALAATASRPTALLLEVRGAIGPATADYIGRALEQARRDDYRLVILRLDTPGGLDSSMRDIIKAILGSPVPVASYVAPGGARAASAGTYILYASHIAAMAPATNLGAATPVQIGGLPGAPKGDDKGGEGEGAMERKLVNDAAAYLRSLARLHGRNESWAEQAVREAASLSAAEALEKGVIDRVAGDLPELLRQIDGVRVTAAGAAITLDTASITIDRQVPDWRNELLSFITNPNIAYILMLLGIYGLIYEFANPGALLPGVAGAICLLLALFAFQVLPINYAGLALMLLGIVFMLAEAFVPSFGALGLGGLAAFVVGSIILVDEEGHTVSIPLIAGTALVSAGFFVGVMGRLYRLRRRRFVSGAEQMVGSVGEASAEFVDGAGRVWIHGESWRARSREPLVRGRRVRVVAMDGLTLIVEPITEEP